MSDLLPWLVSGVCLLTGAIAVAWRPTALVNWLFLAGMALLAGERILDHRAILFAGSGQEATWLWRSMLLRSFTPAVWLLFSLVYARGNRAEFLARWRWILIVAFLAPTGLVLFLGDQLFEVIEGARVTVLPIGKLWVIGQLLVTLAILINLEKTFRSSVGMSRWRIKYLFLGTSLIFGVKLYTLSQVLLFSSFDPSLGNLTAVSVVLGCLLIAVGHARSSFGSFDLYPSRAVLQGSLTVVLAGGYFLIVGLLAQVVKLLGGSANFPAQALIVLVGVVGLTVLFLSERFRRALQRFVSRHFQRPEHDFRKVWAEFTRRTSSVLEVGALAMNAAEVVSESFHVLGVTVFAAGEVSGKLEKLHSTEKKGPTNPVSVESVDWQRLAQPGLPFNLEASDEVWAESLRESCPKKFDHGGDRWVVPLVSGEDLEGLLVLADRVNGLPYTHEERDLLKCIGDQLAAGLRNCKLTEEVLQAKELEAFQTVSTFFVHDLKNAANSLNLMLQNLPVHFDDPEFREDALRAVGRTVDRINKMILNLSSLRMEMQLSLKPTRLDLLIEEQLAEFEKELGQGQALESQIEVLPELPLDAGAMQSVLTNLLVNAAESLQGGGLIQVTAREEEGRAVVRLEDTGQGMSEEFIRNQLFRPFHSTKSKGLGVGMFQCKKIIEAHGGSINVKSVVGEGTCITLQLPFSANERSPKKSP